MYQASTTPTFNLRPVCRGTAQNLTSIRGRHAGNVRLIIIDGVRCTQQLNVGIITEVECIVACRVRGTKSAGRGYGAVRVARFVRGGRGGLPGDDEGRVRDAVDADVDGLVGGVLGDGGGEGGGQEGREG